MNLPGIWAAVRALARPGLIVPHVRVPSASLLTAIAELDWTRIHAAGIRYLVFDKDNCLTRPHEPQLEPALVDAWAAAKHTFGAENILIVSNSAGTRRDPLGVDAENVSARLGVPVLLHKSPKPGVGCARAIVDYVRTSAPYPRAADEAPRVLVVGDRLLTDAALAHRVGTLLKFRTAHRARPDLLGGPIDAHSSVPYCVSVQTTHLWAPEKGVVRLFSRWERAASNALARRGVVPGGGWRALPHEQLPFAVRATAPAAAQAQEPAQAPSREDLGKHVIMSVVGQAVPAPLRRVGNWIAAAIRRITQAPMVAAQISNARSIVGAAGAEVRSSVNACRVWPPRRSRYPFDRRGYHTQVRGVHSAARRSGFWRRALYALMMVVIAPLGFYGGMLLNEYVDFKSAGDLSHEGEAPAARAEQPKSATQPEPAPPKQGDAGRLAPAEVYRELQRYEMDHYHMRHELESVRSKLARIEARHG